MEKRRIVVLFGDSLLMDTVAAGLSDKQELGVMRIYTPITGVEEQLMSLSPDMIIFDLDAPHLEFMIHFLRDHPGVPLLGLDVTSSKVIVISSQQHTTLTADDLAQMIQLQTCSHFRARSYRVSERKIGPSCMFGTLGKEFLQ